MPGPAARVGDTTATGDTITGPGVPTVLIGGMPAAVLGDMVSGAACVGAITLGSFTVTNDHGAEFNCPDPFDGLAPLLC